MPVGTSEGRGGSHATAPAFAFSRLGTAGSAVAATSLLLLLARAKSPFPILLADRFLPGAGVVETGLLAAYAGLLANRLSGPLPPRAWAAWRKHLWLLFSFVFFGQLALGLMGLETFLMTGRLHLPIPAVILAGPVYRGEGFFMPILFVSTVVLAGPAWCSWLCYFGSLDLAAASSRRAPRVPRPLPRWRRAAQYGLLFGVVAAAWGLRAAGAGTLAAVVAALAFAVAGAGLMAVHSRRTGAMVHCTTWCPIGLVATVLGRINPFRLTIGTDCNDCGACTTACRYDALSAGEIARRRPGASCTLCGDCLSTCHGRHLAYACGPLSPGAAHRVYVVILVTLHAVFLGCARI